ncbi:hypothetical protein HYY75_00675 [bacterium]|nr:hypothetical protein [bacterium]
MTRNFGHPTFFAVIIALVFLGGCGKQKPSEVKPNSANIIKSSSAKPESTLASYSVETGKKKSFYSKLKDPLVVAFEKERKREAEITGMLEQASQMVKGVNYGGALRMVQRIEQENPTDSNTLMRTSYMKAMIYHRMKDSPKRKEAMNQMLKNMEALQKDPRFREAFEEGQSSVSVIKKSVERLGAHYGK